MPEAPEVLEETVTVEEDPGTPTSHVSIVTSEDGTTRRTETKVPGPGSGSGQAVWHSGPICKAGCVLASCRLPLTGRKAEVTLASQAASPPATPLPTRSPRQSRQ